MFSTPFAAGSQRFSVVVADLTAPEIVVRKFCVYLQSATGAGEMTE